jgi:hypothetical protein
LFIYFAACAPGPSYSGAMGVRADKKAAAGKKEEAEEEDEE